MAKKSSGKAKMNPKNILSGQLASTGGQISGTKAKKPAGNKGKFGGKKK